MSLPRPRRAHAVAALAAALALPATACQSWHRRSVTPGAATALSGDHPVRVTRSDRSTFVLDHARLVGDSIVGVTGRPASRVAVAISDVVSVEERKVSAGRTAGAVVGGVALIYVVAGLLVVLAYTAAY
jgi:hypothetical protein